MPAESSLCGPVVGRVRAVLVGRAVPFARPGTRSAIDKRPCAGPVQAGPSGLAGDEQGDPRVHGGVDKAVHVYPWGHLDAWRRELPPDSACAWEPGAFGENLSIQGATEDEVCLGERWRIGGARFEISQGRQPCWKLNHRFGVDDMAHRVQASGRTGWYLRVIEPGLVAAGDVVVREAQPFPDWPVARLMAAIHDRNCDAALLQQILALPLPATWQRLFATRLQTGQPESWHRRLQGLDAR
jgi:MOSC domain-containing protein YiiM